MMMAESKEPVSVLALSIYIPLQYKISYMSVPSDELFVHDIVHLFLLRIEI